MLSNYSVRKPYTVVVAVILILILGAVSFLNIHTDLLPSLNLPYSVIITSYPGASPEEVELIVTRPIEQSMASISNIKSVSSVSREHMSLVILEFTESTNMDSAVIEMRESLDMISSYLPDGVGSSNIMKINPDMMPVMVISAAVEGQDIAESSNLLETKIIPEIESVEGVASVNASGLIKNQIHIILSDDKIADVNAKIKDLITEQMKKAAEAAALAAGTLPGNMPGGTLPETATAEPMIPEIAITKEMVSGILKGQNFSMPSGYITEEGVEYLVRTGDRIDDFDALKALTVMVMPIEGMDPITLEDVADLLYLNNSSEMYSKVNGTDAVTLTVQKQTEYVTSDVSKRINEKIESLRSEYSDIQIVTLMDQGEYIDIVVNSLSMNLIFGGGLAILILILFLRDLKPTLIVGVAIPISLVAAFALMYFSDITLNIISMGGLALGVGMLVDNSIVVIENIYRMRNEGKSAIDAAVDGAKQVSGAIMASTLTTVAVFLPIVFVQGFTREIFTDMGLTIAYSLLASLVIALTLVPTMAAKVLVKNVNKDHKIFEAIKKAYTKVLVVSLKHKFAVILLVFLLFGASVYGAINMGTELFPATDSGQINVSLSLPVGSQFSDLTAVADEVAAKILEIPSVESVGASVGGGAFGMGRLRSGGSGTTASFYVALKEDRDLSTDEVVAQIIEKNSSDAYELSVSGTDMNMGALTGSGISIEIKGNDFDTLERIATEVATIVSSVKGTTEVSNGIEETAPELRLTVDKEKSIEHGLTVASVFMEVNKLLSDETKSTSLSQITGDIDVFVKDGASDREVSRTDVLDLIIKSPTGADVKVRDIATMTEASGFKSINRANQQRYVTVSASLLDGYNIGLVSKDINAALASYTVPSGYALKVAGENETINESFKDLFMMLALAVVFIYLIMVAQFQSLLSPFIVMFTIPLAFTGGFFGLMVAGMPLSIVAFVGLIVLSGIVVNNGIVFVDYANKMRENGLSLQEALIKTGTDRLRPILMTALTTIFALSTTSIGAGTGTEMMQPMAVTAIGGLIYATLLTLILVPVMYALTHRE
ncbi:MAG TPA: AcrB/AcrD/AcrF family protein [Clostridiales bacterium UBA8960]|nr:AcrB/AcrD/AcrF family protein [Clostridiales bacterium UBA8960]